MRYSMRTRTGSSAGGQEKRFGWLSGIYTFTMFPIDATCFWQEVLGGVRLSAAGAAACRRFPLLPRINRRTRSRITTTYSEKPTPESLGRKLEKPHTRITTTETRKTPQAKEWVWETVTDLLLGANAEDEAPFPEQSAPRLTEQSEAAPEPEVNLEPAAQSDSEDEEVLLRLTITRTGHMSAMWHSSPLGWWTRRPWWGRW